MDVNAFEFAAEQCGALDVWNAVGVNRPVAGLVEDPLRVEPRAYAVRQSPPSYVCGAVAVSLNGRRPPSAVTLTSAIERLEPTGASGPCATARRPLTDGACSCRR